MSRFPRPRTLLAALVLPLALLLSIPASQAEKTVHRWMDDKGRVRYQDAAAPTPSHSRLLGGRVAAPDSTSVADLHTERVGLSTNVYVFNRLAGPLQMTLSFTEAFNVVATPGFPLHQVLPANARVLVGRVDVADTGQASSFALGMTAMPGDPAAQPRDVSYLLPVDERSDWELGQSYHGGFSHNDEQNRFAVDLIVPEGTPVLAARSGVVMQVESGFDGNGDRREYAGRANLIRVLHDDGSMAVYAHLMDNGVYVNVGDRVSLGQQIASSGNTGFSSGPHLHFVVQVNRGMRLASVPFRMVGPNGYLQLR